MPNTINNDIIFEMNNTDDVDEPAMNSVDDHPMPPFTPLPAKNQGGRQCFMPPPRHWMVSLGSVEGCPVISAARLEDNSCATPKADLAKKGQKTLPVIL